MLKDKGILDTKKLRQVKSFGKKQKTKTPLIIKILGMVLERFKKIIFTPNPFFFFAKVKCIMGNFNKIELCPVLIHFATGGLPTLVFVEVEAQ